MGRRPPLVSRTGLALAVVVLLAILAWVAFRGPGLFSSGPLNSAASGPSLGGVTNHAQFESDCGTCHPAPWSSETMADRCLTCHTSVGSEIASKKGLHARLLGAPSSATCRGCHLEHNGATGALTVFDRESFRHDLTGFSLRTHDRTSQGKQFACADCHTTTVTVFEQAICVDCHTAIDAGFIARHAATYGEDCLPCHDGTGRDGVNYDHSTGPFKLLGAHAEAACMDCHTDARSAADLRNTPQDCYSCHADDDEHEGAFGRQCEDCHSAARWGDATFEHSVFPLDHGSDERRATCQTCHPTGTERYTCYGCHEHTEANVAAKHEGQSLAELADCVRCHAGGREAENE